MVDGGDVRGEWSGEEKLEEERKRDGVLQRCNRGKGSRDGELSRTRLRRRLGDMDRYIHTDKEADWTLDINASALHSFYFDLIRTSYIDQRTRWSATTKELPSVIVSWISANRLITYRGRSKKPIEINRTKRIAYLCGKHLATTSRGHLVVPRQVS